MTFHAHSDVLEYLTAGKAVITLESVKSGKHYTYKVSLPRDGDKRWFVGLLTGPDNEHSYSYIGLLESGNGLSFRCTAKSKLTDDSVPVRGLRYMLAAINSGAMPKDMLIRHEGSCGRCGRTLTVPESLERGIGPECAKMGGMRNAA